MKKLLLLLLLLLLTGIVSAQPTIEAIITPETAYTNDTINLYCDLSDLGVSEVSYLEFKHSASRTNQADVTTVLSSRTTYWVENDSFSDGLPLSGGTSMQKYYVPRVVTIDDELYAIAGTQYGFESWHWNGTSWVVDTSVINGLPIDGTARRGITLFLLEEELYLIYSRGNNMANGYKWNGTGWDKNLDIIVGLPQTATTSILSPVAFWLEDELYIVTGSQVHAYLVDYQYRWNGTSWINDPSIRLGLPSTLYSVPGFNYYDGVPILIQGGHHAGINNRGVYWNGTGWVVNDDIVGLLNPRGQQLSQWFVPELFYYNDSLHMIVGTRNYGMLVYSLDTIDSSINYSITTDVFTNHKKGFSYEVYCDVLVNGTWHNGTRINDTENRLISNYVPEITFINKTGDNTFSMIANDEDVMDDDFLVFDLKYDTIEGTLYKNYTGYKRDILRSNIYHPEVLMGLPTTGSGHNLKPQIFYYQGETYLLAGGNQVSWLGFRWTGNNWVTDNDIITGLPTLRERYFTPSVYYKEGILYLLTGTMAFGYHSYYHNGTSWVVDDEMIEGLCRMPLNVLGCYGDCWFCGLSVFHHEGMLKMITADHGGTSKGYYWSGNEWVLNNSIKEGLTHSTSHPIPYVYYNNGLLSAFVSSQNSIQGYLWNDNSWVSNPSLTVTGLSGRNGVATFWYDQNLFIITGTNSYGLNNAYKYIFLDKDYEYIDVVVPYNQYLDGLHGLKGTSFNVSVRGYDLEEMGSWSDPLTYTFPNRPPVSQASVANTKAYYISNLIGVCEAYDLDLGDTVFDYYFKWYKNGEEYFSGGTLGLTNGTYNLHNISISETSYNDTWVFSCAVSDGGDLSLWTNSSSLTLDELSIGYENVYPKDDLLLHRSLETNLTVQLNFTDANMNIDVHFYWEDGTLIELFSDVSVGQTLTTFVSNLSAGVTHCWYVNGTYNGLDFEKSDVWCFIPNDEPNIFNLRISDVTASNLLIEWENIPNMQWFAAKIGSDISEVRLIAGVVNNWSVTTLAPNKEYSFEFQLGDNLTAMSDYYTFMFRTFGWNPSLIGWNHKRIMTVNSSLIDVDRNNYAVNVTLNEDNFQTCGEYWWEPCYPSFINLNYTDGSDLRFMDYYDYQPLRYEITKWDVPGQGGLSYQTIPDEFYGAGDWLDYDNAHDGDWNTNAIPNPFGIDYFNYTIPVGAKTTSLFRIYAGEWGWDIPIPAECFGGEKLVFKTEANYTSTTIITSCQDNTTQDWVQVWNTTQSRLVYETMITWMYEVDVHITVMPYYFNDELRGHTEGVDGDYDVKFLMYYGNPTASPNQTTVNEEGLFSDVVIIGEEIYYAVELPVIISYNDTEGITATGINISWSVDQAVDNRIRYATNPYLLESTWASRIINRTENFYNVQGNAERTFQLDLIPEDYLGLVSVTASNPSYNDNYTINDTKSPMEITFHNLNTNDFINWEVTYTENKTRYRNNNFAEFQIEGLLADTQYWYEINAIGLVGTTTQKGTFTLGSPPATPMAEFYSYDEMRQNKQVEVCFNVTDLNGNPDIDFSIQYWNTTSEYFSETSVTESVGLGVQCKIISVGYDDTWYYRAKLEDGNIGYSEEYENLFMAPQEFFAGSYITDNDQNLYRQYCPPDFEGHVDESATCYEQTGYREGSHRLEDWIWIETNITGHSFPYKVVWWDGFSWSTHSMTAGSDFHYLKLEGLGGEWQTFYITDSFDNLLLNWTKPSLLHPAGKSRKDTSKYVAFSITPSVVNYTQMYFRPMPAINTTSFNYCQLSEDGNLYDCMSSTYWGTEGMSSDMVGTKYDRGQLFRGGIWNGDIYDTGTLQYSLPVSRDPSYIPQGYHITNATEARYCFSFTLSFFNESMYSENNIENYYFRLWQEDEHYSSYLGVTQEVTWDYIGLFTWKYDPRTFVRNWQTQEDTKLLEEDITVVGTYDLWGGYDKSLRVGYKEGFEFDISEYGIYESGIQTDGQWNNILMGKNHRSFVIFNLPDNDTLMLMDSDGDGLSDYDELFVYFTDPFHYDTSENGWDDYFLVMNGYDPNNPLSQPGPNVTLISPVDELQTNSITLEFFAYGETPTGIVIAQITFYEESSGEVIYAESTSNFLTSDYTGVFGVDYVDILTNYDWFESPLDLNSDYLVDYLMVCDDSGAVCPVEYDGTRIAVKLSENIEYEYVELVDVNNLTVDLSSIPGGGLFVNISRAPISGGIGYISLVGTVNVAYEIGWGGETLTIHSYGVKEEKNIYFDIEMIPYYHYENITWDVKVTDELGLTNTSENRNIRFLLVYGCTDDGAYNYDPDANMDDGSCIYQTPPVIHSKTPVSDLVQGHLSSSTYFAILATDPEMDPLTYEWYINGTPQSHDDYNIWIDNYDLGLGVYNVTVVVTDGYYNVSEEWELTIYNNPPNITSYYPLGYYQSTLYLEIINFSVTVDDPDPEVIAYEWYINGTPQNHNQELLTINNLEVGFYNITVTASDIEVIVSQEWLLQINKTTPVLSINGTSPIYQGTMSDFFGIGCPAELTCVMNYDNQIFSVGTYLFNYSTIGNNNYHSAYATKELVVETPINNPPVITYFTPANVTPSINYDEEQYFMITAHDPDEDPLTYEWFINNTGQGHNHNNITINGTLGVGVYNITAVVGDGILYDEQSWTLTIIDNLPPVITIHSPQNITYYDNNTLINISATDNVEVDEIWYYYNGTNHTYTNTVTRFYGEGQHTLIVWANDTNSLLSSEEVTFTISLEEEPPTPPRGGGGRTIIVNESLEELLPLDLEEEDDGKKISITNQQLLLLAVVAVAAWLLISGGITTGKPGGRRK